MHLYAQLKIHLFLANYATSHIGIRTLSVSCRKLAHIGELRIVVLPLEAVPSSFNLSLPGLYLNTVYISWSILQFML